MDSQKFYPKMFPESSKFMVRSAFKLSQLEARMINTQVTRATGGECIEIPCDVIWVIDWVYQCPTTAKLACELISRVQLLRDCKE